MSTQPSSNPTMKGGLLPAAPGTPNFLGACEPCFLRGKKSTATHLVGDTPFCSDCYYDEPKPKAKLGNAPNFPIVKRASGRAKEVREILWQMPMGMWREIELPAGRSARAEQAGWIQSAQKAGGKVETHCEGDKLFVRRVK